MNKNRNILDFAESTRLAFGNDASKLEDFMGMLVDASTRTYTQFSERDTNATIRQLFDDVLGINFKSANSMRRRQAWRAHGKEIATLIENIVAEKMVTTSWSESNNDALAGLVEEVNIAEGDRNEFYVMDNSLLQVSRFAGNHHDIVRQAIKPGKVFQVETSAYTIKVYTDYALFQTGRIDFAELVDRMYASIESNRKAALYTAFMTIDQTLPTDMVLETAISETTKDAIVNHIEAVKAACGHDVILVGSRVAIQKLQNCVGYNMWSDAMKTEKNEKGVLANFEGYSCIALDRVNKSGTRESIFSEDDNKKIFIIPADADFKPIKRVNEGDVAYYETGMDGLKKDMTVDAELTYWEGIGVVVNELFGEIIAA